MSKDVKYYPVYYPIELGWPRWIGGLVQEVARQNYVISAYKKALGRSVTAEEVDDAKKMMKEYQKAWLKQVEDKEDD